MTPKHSSGGESAGFTLMEIMIVVVLISIMTALILPEMKGTYQDSLLRSNARELVNACKLAYSRSVSLNQSHRVLIDPRNGRYVIEKRVIDRGGDTFVPLRDVPGSDGTLDTRVTIVVQKSSDLPEGESTQSTDLLAPNGAPVPIATEIAFYPDGTAEGADILLRDREGFRLVLRINPTTARIRILEPTSP